MPSMPGIGLGSPEEPVLEIGLQARGDEVAELEAGGGVRTQGEGAGIGERGGIGGESGERSVASARKAAAARRPKARVRHRGRRSRALMG